MPWASELGPGPLSQLRIRVVNISRRALAPVEPDGSACRLICHTRKLSCDRALIGLPFSSVASLEMRDGFIKRQMPTEVTHLFLEAFGSKQVAHIGVGFHDP